MSIPSQSQTDLPLNKYQPQLEELVAESQSLSSVIQEARGYCAHPERGTVVNSELLERRFWKEFAWPQVEKTYFRIFHASPSLDPLKQTHPLQHAHWVSIALCEWLRTDGLVHSFENHVFVVILDTTELAFGCPEGMPVWIFTVEGVGELLAGMAKARIRKQEQAKEDAKVKFKLFGLGAIALLIYMVISYACGR